MYTAQAVYWMVSMSAARQISMDHLRRLALRDVEPETEEWSKDFVLSLDRILWSDTRDSHFLKFDRSYGSCAGRDTQIHNFL